VQQYVQNTGQDVRVLVVGGRAVAAVRRRPRVGRLSYTLNRGARLERIELTESQRVAAERTAALVGLEVAAVDLLDVPEGDPKVFEVNSSPALPEMEAATGLDVASIIIQRAEELAAGQPGLRAPEPTRRVPPKRKRVKTKTPGSEA
jgi:ribosomal protein S6--L-glutamate ligase